MRKRTGILILLVFLLLTSCNANTSTGKSTDVSDQKVKEEPPKQEQKTEAPKQAEPKKESNETSAYIPEGVRPYAVMIDNEGVRVLPQGGLEKAKIIYEIIVEGGESRLMPIFWDSDVNMIGPVRSSRHYFLDYVMEHDAIYVHFGYSPQAMEDIPKLKINNINGVANGGEIFFDITSDKNNWQDSYTTMDKIKGYEKKAGYRTTTDKKPVFEYNKPDTEINGGQKAEKINLKYSNAYNCGYDYDSADKSYLRLRKGNPQIERATGKQLRAKNIVIQLVSNRTIAGDDKGRQEMNNVGNGQGWFITCGKAIKIKWSKESRTAQTKYVDESGSPIMLNPGQTWVQIVPADGKIVIE